MALNINRNLRNGDVLSNWKRLVNFEIKSFNWVDFSIKEKKIFRSVVQRSNIEANPFFFWNGVIGGIKLWFTEASSIHPHPFPIPPTSSETIKCTPGLISLWIESTEFLLVLLIFFVKVNIIQPDLSITVSTEAFVRNYSISDNCCALIVSSYVSIIGIQLNLVLMSC